MQRVDVLDAAGHAHHAAACMASCLLPCSLSAEVEERTPLFEEQRQLQARRAPLASEHMPVLGMLLCRGRAYCD